MSYTIEEGSDFGLSFARAAQVYSAVDLSRRLLEFIRWKQQGNNGFGGPFSNDKQSGHRPDGTIFQQYLSGGFLHCHFDLSGTEPLLAYRQFEDKGLVVIICITNHHEMFDGNEKRFVKSHKRTIRGRSVGHIS